ncbi:hypothetical protein [Paenibacillus soyae]|uniref:Lipoprotein n=1 Tax=Paenibacillus soyae TaxID=2969249 RepID=A0A9X2SB47_9BACL|nr:hypothetical protein [Paenibacillus soyae]MCR2806645.1 hypothetical protein [Paenibacillus soyae]
MKNILFTLLTVVLIAAGCEGQEKRLTLAQVTDMFEASGILLHEAEDLHPDNVFTMTLNGVEPAAYQTEQEQLISIYIFPSSEALEKGIEDFEAKTALADVVSHGRYQVANVLIFTPIDETDHIDRVEQVIAELKSMTTN